MNLLPTKYFGKTKHIRSLGNYHLSITHHSKEGEIPKHSHMNPYLSLNLGAAYLENNGFAKNIIESGNVILRPSDYEHQNTFAKNAGLCFNIEITSKKNSKAFEKMNINFSCFEFLQILTKAFNNYLDNELDCLITETIFQKLDITNTNKTPSWYIQIIEKIKDDYSSSLSLSSLANSVSLHPNYLARKFKSLNGMTLGDYIRKTRLENACLELSSNKRLTDISLETGFYDQSHFSNTFRSTFNMSPKELRHFCLG